MKNKVAKPLLLIILFLVIILVFRTKNETKNTIEEIPNETEISPITPVLKSVLDNLIEGKRRSELWPGYMVLFSSEDSAVYIIGSLLYFEKGCKGFKIINDIIFAFYGHEGSNTFHQNFVNFENLPIKEIICCSYENKDSIYTPAFDEEYWKFLFFDDTLTLISQGRVEHLQFSDTIQVPEIIIKIKERLSVPPPPK